MHKSENNIRNRAHKLDIPKLSYYEAGWHLKSIREQSIDETNQHLASLLEYIGKMSEINLEYEEYYNGAFGLYCDINSPHIIHATMPLHPFYMHTTIYMHSNYLIIKDYDQYNYKKDLCIDYCYIDKNHIFNENTLQVEKI